MVIKRTENHESLEELYIKCGLELKKGQLASMSPIFSIVAEKNGIIAGGATVSKRFGVYILDYIAVEKNFRKQKIGTKLFEKIAEEYDEFFLTAKVPEFFGSAGCKTTDKKPELLKECDGCDQYKKGCNPIVLRYCKGE